MTKRDERIAEGFDDDDFDDEDEDEDEDDFVEPTDEELMDIDSEIFANAEIPPEELARMEAEQAAAAAAPKKKVVCPYCGATTTPDEKGCCEYCGAPVA